MGKEIQTGWKVLSTGNTYRPYWTSSVVRGISLIEEFYPLGIWVTRNPRLGPLMLYSTKESAVESEIGNHYYPRKVVQCEYIPSDDVMTVVVSIRTSTFLENVAEYIYGWREPENNRKKWNTDPGEGTVFADAIRCLE